MHTTGPKRQAPSTPQKKRVRSWAGEGTMGQTEEGADSRRQSERRRKNILEKGGSFFPFPLGYGMEKQWLFWGPVQTRQLWKKLMAMINDNGLEESGDTAATYIIPSRQSPLLCPSSSSQPGTIKMSHLLPTLVLKLKSQLDPHPKDKEWEGRAWGRVLLKEGKGGRVGGRKRKRRETKRWWGEQGK